MTIFGDGRVQLIPSDSSLEYNPEYYIRNNIKTYKFMPTDAKQVLKAIPINLYCIF